jgi:hypothetical protein
VLIWLLLRATVAVCLVEGDQDWERGGAVGVLHGDSVVHIRGACHSHLQQHKQHRQQQQQVIRLGGLACLMATGQQDRAQCQQPKHANVEAGVPPAPALLPGEKRGEGATEDTAWLCMRSPRAAASQTAAWL